MLLESYAVWSLFFLIEKESITKIKENTVNLYKVLSYKRHQNRKETEVDKVEKNFNVRYPGSSSA